VPALAAAAVAAAATASAWTPPLGIPAPPFGIDQTVTENQYTHWVDNSVACTDTANNGTPARPRCTIPDTLPAGSVVQVRGGPYGMGRANWSLDGTAAQPVFVRGPSGGPLPFLGPSADVRLSARYAVVENLRMPRLTFTPGSSNHHVALRGNQISDHPGIGSLIDVGTDNHHIVIYDCEVARNGTIPSGVDNHGVGLQTDGISDVWIVDNRIHHNSGDAIQFCHGCTLGPARVYIGRNDLHDDEENAIDLKEFIGPVVISQNRMHGYVPGADSGGEDFRVND
jgi:hypothetical protein